MNLFNKRFAFTLSEVMVTLTLIGFIATMTLSTVGSSIQQRARLSEFRAAYSKMEAALKSVSIDEGKVYSCYNCPSSSDITKYGLSISGTCSNKKTQCGELNAAFVRAMGATRYCETNPVTEGCLPANYPKATGCFTDYENTKAYVLDNSMILIHNDKNSDLLQFAVDVNGRKGPNKWGQDIFTFAVKATASNVFNNKTYITDVGILPPDSCLPGKSNDTKKSSTRSSDQLLEDSTNYSN